MSETSPLVRLWLGQLCHHATYAYDANGNRTMFERDSNSDGTVDNRGSTAFAVVNRWTSAWVE